MAESSNIHEILIEQPSIQTEDYFEMDVPKDVIKEATPRIISQDSVHTCLDPFRMDNFTVDIYAKNMNTLLEPSNFSTTIPRAKKYESISASIAFSLKSSPPPELNPSLVTPEYACLELSDTFLVPIGAESGCHRIQLEWRWTRSPSGSCKIKFHPKSVGGGSDRTLRRSSQLWPTKMECSEMS
ncbi:hypothetical protein COCNU_scaffold002524G000030 [Cocos nucifera]|nr:hypothetical protein [Cocos nucifera]